MERVFGVCMSGGAAAGSDVMSNFDFAFKKLGSFFIRFTTPLMYNCGKSYPHCL